MKLKITFVSWDHTVSHLALFTIPERLVSSAVGSGGGAAAATSAATTTTTTTSTIVFLVGCSYHQVIPLIHIATIPIMDPMRHCEGMTLHATLSAAREGNLQ